MYMNSIDWAPIEIPSPLLPLRMFSDQVPVDCFLRLEFVSVEASHVEDTILFCSVEWVELKPHTRLEEVAFRVDLASSRLGSE